MHDNNTNNNLQSQSSNITFGKKIYQFKLEDINNFTQQFYCNMSYSDELQLGMHHLIDCLELWLNEIFDTEFDNEASIEIYNAVKLSSNSDRIRATERFNNKNILMLQLNGQLVDKRMKRMSLFLVRYVY